MTAEGSPDPGPERLDRFMARANAAYYARRDPFADFVTAPEISQVFGELLGAWTIAMWEALGSPDPVLLVELGPGRGTLLDDALRVIRKARPRLAAALRLHLVETSPRLAGLLAERLPGCTIHPRLEDVPAGAAIILGNEFLDALPIRQFVRRGDGWAERHVAAAAFVERAAGAEGPRRPPADAAEGDIVERSDAAEAVVREIARRVAAPAADGPACALLIDYGGEAEIGDTLQALRAARPAPPLANPGEADLTAHVDFAAIRAVAASVGIGCHGPVPQGLFLTRLGLYQRIRVLAERDPRVIDGANRLAQPERMGVLFKAIALVPLAVPVPPGFENPHER